MKAAIFRLLGIVVFANVIAGILNVLQNILHINTKFLRKEQKGIVYKVLANQKISVKSQKNKSRVLFK